MASVLGFSLSLSLLLAATPPHPPGEDNCHTVRSPCAEQQHRVDAKARWWVAGGDSGFNVNPYFPRP